MPAQSRQGLHIGRAEYTAQAGGTNIGATPALLLLPQPPHPTPYLSKVLQKELEQKNVKNQTVTEDSEHLE